ncbi:MAG: hypothetical protein V1933_08595, partial [Candidatus Omnitrophota bacterium]
FFAIMLRKIRPEACAVNLEEIYKRLRKGKISLSLEEKIFFLFFLKNYGDKEPRFLSTVAPCLNA